MNENKNTIHQNSWDAVEGAPKGYSYSYKNLH